MSEKTMIQQMIDKLATKPYQLFSSEEAKNEIDRLCQLLGSPYEIGRVTGCARVFCKIKDGDSGEITLEDKSYLRLLRRVIMHAYSVDIKLTLPFHLLIWAMSYRW